MIKHFFRPVVYKTANQIKFENYFPTLNGLKELNKLRISIFDWKKKLTSKNLIEGTRSQGTKYHQTYKEIKFQGCMKALWEEHHMRVFFWETSGTSRSNL